jgi:Protein of unknown function (DUF1553)/Protein of unknown function (DUF1549)/Planctomycete cytochrome C
MMTIKPWLLLGVAAAAVGYFSFKKSKEVDYNSQVKPILNKHCIACHGGVKQAAGFSLLFREDALAKTKSGRAAIVVGDAAHSEFITRLSHHDPEERMPYRAEPLKTEEIEILTNWVNQGLKWEDHWAYVKPTLPSVPKPFFEGLTTIFSDNGKTDIDYFVEKKLQEQGLEMSNEAPRNALIRRVCLDLTGLPPTLQQLEKYSKINDWNAGYKQLVDELLASSSFGERWATMWLDLARYSDSRGYQKDNARNIWKYRDWVIKAFNADKPFDKFTTEQIAGDLLPQPTTDNLIATAFHRNTLNNDETGTVDEEFRVTATLDRVNTTWETWQSTSFGCVQCHSHPYDPFRHDEYYKFLAYFNNTRDEDTIDEAPFLREFNKEDNKKVNEIEEWIGDKNNNSKKRHTGVWGQFLHFLEPRHHAHYADNYQKGTLVSDRNIGLKNGGSCRLPNIQLTNKSQLIVQIAVSQLGTTLQIRLDSTKGQVIGQIDLDTTKNKKREIHIWPIQPSSGRHDVYLTASNKKIGPEDYPFEIAWFAFMPDFPNKNAPGYSAKFDLYKQLLETKTDNTPIQLASDTDYERVTNVFVRGNWLSKGAVVNPDLPHSLIKNNRLPKNRLGLAQWLVSSENPLTARVMVNRFWEQIFGIGLVETLEDFGTAGAKPTHPELLDYLAMKYSTDWRWSTKRLLKEIVLSKTYKQNSALTPNDPRLVKDPQNRYLSHAPRIRLSAETIRDQALAVSGLLSKKMYGQPVMPYQPDGVWQAVNSNLEYEQSVGEDQFRRAVYTFARRTGPYPSALTFDAGSREACLSRRIRTNTPLQALTLMNDPVFMEASVALAKRVDNNPKSIAMAYQLATCKDIDNLKLQKLNQLYQKALYNFGQHPERIAELVKEKPSAKMAALAVVCNAILNLDEVVTKQ